MHPTIPPLAIDIDRESVGPFRLGLVFPFPTAPNVVGRKGEPIEPGDLVFVAPTESFLIELEILLDLDGSLQARVSQAQVWAASGFLLFGKPVQQASLSAVMRELDLLGIHLHAQGDGWIFLAERSASLGVFGEEIEIVSIGGKPGHVYRNHKNVDDLDDYFRISDYAARGASKANGAC
jgi:hypothetical protein